jgi:hypothetical protein
MPQHMCGMHAVQRPLTSQLNLPRTPALDDLVLRDRRRHRRAAVQRTQGYQHLGHPVVGKHGDLVDVAERPVGLALEARPQVGDEDLGALEEPDRLAGAFKPVLVPEAVKVTGEEVDQAGC